MKPFKKAILIIIVIAVTACAVFGIYNIAYADKVLSGVTAAGIDISGKSETEAAEILQKAINKFQNESIVLQSGNKQWFATPRELGINFYAQTTAKRAFEIGRSNPWHKDLITRAKTIVMDHEIDMVFSIDEISLEKYADKHFGELETSAKNANLKISDNKILKTKEKNGVITNEKDFFKKTRESAEKLNKDPIQISFTTSYPVISEQDTEMAASAAKKIMQNGVKLKHGDKTWEISKGDAVEMISFTPRSKSGHEISKEDLFSKEEGKDNRDITLGLELLGSKLDETLGKISEEIKTDPINAHFEIVDESSLKIPLEGEKPKDTIRDVVLSEPSKNGGKLNKDESFKKIRDEINDGQTMVDLVVDKKEPQVTEKNYKEVGIKKLIGRGESSWSGSPANRIHNIKV
ncbi:MAG: VanW family protein, partial [uncultured bacterium]